MESKEKKKIIIPYWKNQEKPPSGELYTDPLFPPNINSLLGLDKNGKPIDIKAYTENENQIKKDEIEFRRAIDIFGNTYKLFSERIEMADVIQGSLGDCYFLSSVANLCKFPGLIKSLFKTKEMNRDGYYEIFFRIDGKKQIVIVDDYFPVYKKNKWPCFAQPHGKELWVMLLEKAWAKVNGGYVNIIGGMSSQALECLTGFGSLVYNTNKMKPEELDNCKSEIIKNIKIADQSHCLISCATGESGETKIKNLEKVGLIQTHEYTILKIAQISINQGKSEYLFKLRNPWGQKEWNGDWSDKSELWTEILKSQLDFKDKEDGIFFMNSEDFFKYFKFITISYILHGSTVIKYTIEGEENLKNGCVFNVQTDNEGVLSVSALRKNWRTNRELRGKEFPTHISIVKYNPNETDKYKIFSDYSGTYTSYETCTLNIKVNKGNYLIYVYRYFENNNYVNEQSMDIKIICSANFKHAQMPYDDRKKGFPLLQNIILQTEISKRKLDVQLREDYNFTTEQIGGNGIVGYINYNPSPGTFTKLSINQDNLLVISPYDSTSQKSFNKIIPSGKFFVMLALLKEEGGSYSLKVDPFISSQNLTPDFEDNEIDLTLYTDITNDIKNDKFKQRKTRGIGRASKQFYFDIGDGQIQYLSFKDLERTYFNFIKLLDDIPKSKMDQFLKWGVLKGEYVTYVGQFKDRRKEGKGLFINPNNIFAGEFKNDLQNGIGYIYNKEFKKLYHCNYVNGVIVGKKIKETETIQEEDEMHKLEKDLFNKDMHNFENGERYQGDVDKNNKLKEGKGIYYYNNGEKYIGEWKNNLKDGKGTYFYNNGNKYIGEWKNGLKEGKGKMYRNNGQILEANWKNDEMDEKVKIYFNDGQKYEGDYKNNIIEGHGIFYYNNGEVYDGDWKNNLKEGKGIIYYKNKEKYEGDWKNNVKDGKGIFYFIGGEKYDGDWKNDLREGKGIYYSNKGEKIYEGDWKKGEIEGKGTIFYNNGDKYEGEWKEGKIQGKGVLLHKNGDKYEGDWKNEKKDGKGIFYGKNGNKIYEGDWKEDKIEGKGIYYFNNGKYDGDLKDGKLEGKGTFYYENGKYIGDWKNNLKDGKGIFYGNNENKIYEGDWKNDVKEGKGTLYYNSGKYVGSLINNKKEGKGAYYWDNGDKYDGDWKNDVREGKGVNNWNNGEKYEGDWKNDNIEGVGTYYYNGGGKYEGDWINGQKTGKGIYYLNDKKIYEGDWINDIKEGKGIFYYNNGKYDGDWKNNLKEGKGIYYGNDNKKIYDGDWKKDKMEGNGTFFYGNGKYAGEWKDEQKDGKGTFYWDNGDKYEGDWKKDKKEGKGLFSKNNGDKYEGDWINDLKDGKGVEYYNNGEKFEGNWKKGVKEGYGIYLYNNGDKYDGEWKNNLKDGKGIYYFSNGKKAYDGEWKNNLREGNGIFYYNNGRYDGKWKNDKKEGEGIYYWDNGDKFEGHWKNDLREGKGTFYQKDGKKISGEYSKDEFIK